MVKFSVKEQQLLQFLKFLLLLISMQYVSQAGLLKQKDSFLNSSVSIICTGLVSLPMLFNALVIQDK